MAAASDGGVVQAFERSLIVTKAGHNRKHEDSLLIVKEWSRSFQSEPLRKLCFDLGFSYFNAN